MKPFRSYWPMLLRWCVSDCRCTSPAYRQLLQNLANLDKSTGLIFLREPFATVHGPTVRCRGNASAPPSRQARHAIMSLRVRVSAPVSRNARGLFTLEWSLHLKSASHRPNQDNKDEPQGEKPFLSGDKASAALAVPIRILGVSERP